MVQTGTQDFLQSRVLSRVIHLAGADGPADVQHHLHAVELFGKGVASIINRQVMTQPAAAFYS